MECSVQQYSDEYRVSMPILREKNTLESRTIWLLLLLFLLSCSCFVFYIIIRFLARKLNWRAAFNDTATNSAFPSQFHTKKHLKVGMNGEREVQRQNFDEPLCLSRNDQLLKRGKRKLTLIQAHPLFIDFFYRAKKSTSFSDGHLWRFLMEGTSFFC